MTSDDNPLGRRYNDAEVAAARRVGIKGPRGSLGPLVYATGPYWPDRARAMARDWAIVANALDREWKRGEEAPPPSSPAPLDVESFNAAHPVGTEVLYWPGAVVGPGHRSRTRTPAWELSGHAVVSVEDYPGGVLLDHVNTLDEPSRPEVEETELGGPAGVVGYLYKCMNPDCGWAASSPDRMIADPCPKCHSRLSREREAEQ